MRKLVETTLLFVLIVVAALRPLIAESYDSGGSALTAALESVADPRPLHTLLIDLAILLAFCGWAVCHTLGKEPYRKTGLEWGLGLIAAAGVVSCLAASNKRLAVNATIDWLCAPLLAIALANLLRSAWLRHVLLSAVIASAIAQSVQCVEQAAIGFDETWQHYYSIREDLWAKQGVELDSAKAEQFEHRLRAREATGFLQHSNLTGSYLVLAGLAALGICISRFRQAGGFAGYVPAAFLAILIAIALVLTKSRGAFVAALAGLLVFALFRIARRFPRWPRRPLVWVGWGLFSLGLGMVIACGCINGKLPGVSLMFRWQYWSASLAMFLRHPLTGVGRENFGRHYTQFKSIESPEEVANPHDLFVQAGCDWGIIGLVGLVVMLIGWTWRAAAPTQMETVAKDRSRNWLAWAISLIAVMTLVRLPLLGSMNANFLYYSSMVIGLAWLFGFWIVAGRTTTHASANAAIIRHGAIAGLLAFLVHDLINFALFVPATATTFFALLAYTVCDREAGGSSVQRSRTFHRWLPAGLGIVMVGIVTPVAIVPVARAERELIKAAASPVLPQGLEAQPALAHFDAAAAADSLDPTPQLAKAEWLMALSQATPDQRIAAERAAVDALSAAIARDPLSIRLWRLRSRTHLSLGQSLSSAPEYAVAIEDAKHAIALYPASPTDFVLLADVQAVAGEALASDELMESAVMNYAHALVLDDQRLPWEVLRRMRPSEKAAIQAKLKRIRQNLER